MMKAIAGLIFFCFAFSCKSQTTTTKSVSEKLARSASFLGAKYGSSNDSLRKAIELLDSAINIDNTNIHFYTTRSQFYRRLGEYEKALADFDRVLTLKKDMAEALMGKGFILEKLKRGTEASIDYMEGLKPMIDA